MSEISKPHSRLDEIGRTLRHAQATRRTETDSWLNGYQDDVAWLIEQLEALRNFNEATRAAYATLTSSEAGVGAVSPSGSPASDPASEPRAE